MYISWLILALREIGWKGNVTVIDNSYGIPFYSNDNEF